MALAFDADDVHEPPVIVFPDPTTAIDEKGVKHHAEHPKDYDLPENSGMAWHPAMGKYVRKTQLNDEWEIPAADYYAKFGKNPWKD